MMRAGLILPAALLVLAACGPPPTPVPASGTRTDPTAAVAAFANVETDALRELVATDRRIALRARLDPREEDGAA